MTIDECIKQVLELDEKVTWLTYPEALESYSTLAPLLAKACQKMKEALLKYSKGKDLRGLGNFNDYCDANKRYALKVLADVDKMFGEYK